MKSASILEAVVAMITDGFTAAKAFRHHSGLPIQYVAARTGIGVALLIVIESGSSASDDEISAIATALELPRVVTAG
ncbi:helix-turn-helix domain-containing protein [Aureimonas glaciei]|uniref:Uncharacterized protein n=1 Tax=Aureimonas glaciei TaxID=1776957 RepID=A0A916Y3C3_9HYPH|nr:helix-turn-helix transcriptional regulator [Aureimonas glaciei]GGD28736.1 hypothetical protein GCM10011335_34890 [Aureimonas glaciei]